MRGLGDAPLVEDVRATLAPGSRVLDVPAGNGKLGRALADAGFRVVSVDILRERFRGRTPPLVAADMTASLPFAAGSMDGVVCQEGIEHLEDPAAFIRQCRWVLRGGGHLWLTTPNVMDLSSRASHFLTGMKSFRSGFPNEAETVRAMLRDASLVHGHAFMLPFFQIRYLLRIQQFDDIALRGLGRSGLGTLLYPLLRPWMGPLIRRPLRRRLVKMRHGLQRRSREELVDELIRHATSRDLLCCRKLLIRARRVEGSFALYSPAGTGRAEPGAISAG